LGTLISALLRALVFQALTGRLVLSALFAALTLHVALRSAAGAFLLLLVLLRQGNAARRKQR
jgi:hypothetical protein